MNKLEEVLNCLNAAVRNTIMLQQLYKDDPVVAAVLGEIKSDVGLSSMVLALMGVKGEIREANSAD